MSLSFRDLMMEGPGAGPSGIRVYDLLKSIWPTLEHRGTLRSRRVQRLVSETGQDLLGAVAWCAALRGSHGPSKTTGLSSLLDTYPPETKDSIPGHLISSYMCSRWLEPWMYICLIAYCFVFLFL